MSGYYRSGVRNGMVPLAAAGAEVAGPVPDAPRASGDGKPQGTKLTLGGLVAEARGLYRPVPWTLLFVGFLAYIFTITTYQINIGDIAVATAVLGLLFQREEFRFPSWLGYLVALLVWCLIGMMVSPYSTVVQNNLTDFAKLCVIVLAAVNAIRHPSQIRFFMVFWVICYALYPVRGTYLNYFVAGYTHFGRALWNYIYANPNDLGALSLLMLSISIALFLSERKGWVQLGAAVSMGLLVVLIFLTQSRAAFLGLAVLGLFALFEFRKHAKMVLMILAIGGVVALVAPKSVWTRLGALTGAADTESLRKLDKEGSAEQRFQIWQTAYKIIRDYPITGVGWGAYPRANAQYAPGSGASEEFALGARDTHSTYLNVTAETGFVGLLIWLGVIGTVAVRAETVRRRTRARSPDQARILFFLLLGLLGFLVAGIFGSYAKLSFLYLHLALIYAVAEVCADQDRVLRLAERRAIPSPAL